MKKLLLLVTLGIGFVGSAVFSMDIETTTDVREIVGKYKSLQAQLGELQLSLLLNDLKREAFVNDFVDQEKMTRESIVLEQQRMRDSIMSKRYTELVEKIKNAKPGSLISINMSGATAVAPATYNNTLVLTDEQVLMLADRLKAIDSSSNRLLIEDVASE